MKYPTDLDERLGTIEEIIALWRADEMPALAAIVMIHSYVLPLTQPDPDDVQWAESQLRLAREDHVPARI